MEENNKQEEHSMQGDGEGGVMKAAEARNNTARPVSNGARVCRCIQICMTFFSVNSGLENLIWNILVVIPARGRQPVTKELGSVTSLKIDERQLCAEKLLYKHVIVKCVPVVRQIFASGNAMAQWIRSFGEPYFTER
jgi:hypothetical protein